MHAIRRILVAVKDPKAKTFPAVDKAAQLARAFGAELELFHAITTPLYIETLRTASSSLIDMERMWQKAVREQMDATAQRIGKLGVKVTTTARWDHPSFEAILRRAKQTKADLVVISCHEGSQRAAGLLHLTDWELLRLSPVPVLIVKNTHLYKNPVVLAAIDPLHTFAKPARLDREILKTGEAFKTALRGTLHAIHAYVPMFANIPPAEYLKPNLAQSIEGKARDLVKRPFERETTAANIPPSRRHLVPEHPIDAIPNTARKTKASIVALGAISRSGLKRFFIGNTAEHLLYAIDCDLLVVKPPRFKSRISATSRGARIVAAQPMTA